jgi:xanthine dehydrogenase YagS FAD-binding subunit
LRGAPATEKVFRRAAEAELAEARPLPGNAFKVRLARNVVVRTLLDLIEMPEEAQP